MNHRVQFGPRPEELYLALVKKALTFGLWKDEPGLPITALNDSRPFLKRGAVTLISRVLDRAGLELATHPRRTEMDRQVGTFWPRYAHTMIGETRLDNIQHCVERAL